MENSVINALVKETAGNGISGSTLESVAAEANLDPDELKHRFPRFTDLVREVTGILLDQLDAVVPEPGGSLENDLRQLAAGYLEFFRRYPTVLAFYAQVAKDEDLRKLVSQKQAATRAKLTDFFAFYRRGGYFAPELDELDDKELEQELAGAFLGSIFGRISWQTMGIVQSRFNLDRFVRLFLMGFGRKSY